DGVYELINSVMPNRPAGTPKYYSTAVQFDSETGTLFSSAQLGAPTTEPEHMRLRFALAGGGAYANGPASAHAVNATINTGGLAAGGNASQLVHSVWGGWSEGPALQMG